MNQFEFSLNKAGTASQVVKAIEGHTEGPRSNRIAQDDGEYLSLSLPEARELSLRGFPALAEALLDRPEMRMTNEDYYQLQLSRDYVRHQNREFRKL